MSLILIKCPETGRVVSIGIEIDRETFNALPDVDAQAKCSACAGTHIWRKRDAWLSDDGEGYNKQPER